MRRIYTQIIQFKELDTSENLQENERLNIETYTKGLNYTDQSTLDFLNQLNDINRPITVIFYGDHLPGIYSTAYSDSDNILGLHETDYFIWSNNASSAAGTKLDDASSAYTSSNYFSTQLASHLQRKGEPLSGIPDGNASSHICYVCSFSSGRQL